MSSIGIATSGRIVVAVHAPGAIQDSDWSSFLGRMRQRDYDGVLVWDPGAGANARQQSALRAAWAGSPPLIGIVTGSTRVKDVISAMSRFLGDRIRGFPPNQLLQALEHVGTPHRHRRRVCETLEHLRSALPIPDHGAFFARLQTEHGAALRRAALRRCSSESDADDLVQEVFEVAFRHAETLRPLSHVRNWLEALLHRRFINRLKKQARERRCDLDLLQEMLPMPEPEPEPEPSWASITAEEVWAAAEQLDPNLRQVFVLYERDRLSYKEIAYRLGVPTSTVGTRINRSRRRLRLLLGSGR